MKYFKQKKENLVAVLGIEVSLIKRNYSFIDCKIDKGVMYCYGQYQPTTESPIYCYRIKYVPPRAPKVHVKSPIIEYDDNIHMYPKDNSLCLYHKTDVVWTTTYHVYNTIIPWTHEWFVFYELYKLKGEWLHPFVPHGSNKEVIE